MTRLGLTPWAQSVPAHTAVVLPPTHFCMTKVDVPGIMTTQSADSQSGNQWLLEHQSRRLRLYGWLLAIGAFLVHVFMAIVVPMGDTGSFVSRVDQFGFIGLGLIFFWLFFNLTRPRLRVNAKGVEVRNLLATKFYVWDEVWGLNFPAHHQWARLELADDEFVPIWALYKADGVDCITAVERFRELEDRYMPEDDDEDYPEQLAGQPTASPDNHS